MTLLFMFHFTLHAFVLPNAKLWEHCMRLKTDTGTEDYYTSVDFEWLSVW